MFIAEVMAVNVDESLLDEREHCICQTQTLLHIRMEDIMDLVIS